MRIEFAGELDPKTPADIVAWIYNALDCAITHEVYRELKPQLADQDIETYRLTMSYRQPLMEMMLRGVRVDRAEMQRKTDILAGELAIVSDWLQELGKAIGLPLRPKTKALQAPHYINPNSPKQLIELFYGVLRLPEIKVYDRQKRESRVSTNRDSLEKLAERYVIARPIVKALLDVRDRSKELTYLRNVDEDGRMRFSFNIGGTETGRISSSRSVWDTGYNGQNIKPAVRSMFIADQGYRLGYIDLEQAESRVVALLAPGLAYWNACHSGDLHTTCCKLIWPRLPWTGDHKKDKAIAETLFYREYTYRDMSKRGGHGTNYYGQPAQMAMHLKVEKQLIEDFQRAYFREFPEIPEWHMMQKEKLQIDRYLITPFGRKRWFHGRPDDNATLREAIAFEPQSTIAEYINIGLTRVWHQLPQVHLLFQVHDAIVFQYHESEPELPGVIQSILSFPLNHNGKSLIIPTEAKTGWNWGAYDERTNPGGLVKWKGPNSDLRQRPSLLDRPVF